MKPFKLILLAVLSFVFFLLINTPATVIQYIIPASSNPSIKHGTLTGTLWQGHATYVRINQHQIDELNWSFKPWRLLLGQLALGIDASYQQRPVSGDLSVSISRTLTLENVNAKFDSSVISDIAQIPFGQLDGLIQIQLQHAELSQSSVPIANGTINWQQASITVADTADLGKVSIVLAETAELPLTARISNQGGVIKLDGNLHLTTTGDYKLELNMLPSANAKANIKKSLEYFAERQDNGSYLYNKSGNISQLGLMQ